QHHPHVYFLLHIYAEVLSNWLKIISEAGNYARFFFQSRQRRPILLIGFSTPSLDECLKGPKQLKS
ncbi:hypothetical protein CISIN_1g040028mg, partial [Citrus sinensis]